MVFRNVWERRCPPPPLSWPNPLVVSEVVQYLDSALVLDSGLLMNPEASQQLKISYIKIYSFLEMDFRFKEWNYTRSIDSRYRKK